MLELEKEYIRTKDYKNQLALYSKAAAIYPFDNWQVRQISCNLEIYRYEEALEIYNNTMELYSREMGSPPTADLQECFERLEPMDENHRRNMNSTNGWKSMDRAFMNKKGDIQKAIFGEEKAKGAYYCSYPSFVDYCRLVVRAKERSQFGAVLMFLTLSRTEKRENRKNMDIQEQMQLLKTAIGTSLRTEDAYTRYGNRHFILMLIKAETEFCSAIFRRIENAYIKSAGKGELWYYADMTQELNESAF